MNEAVESGLLEQVIAAAAEPIVVARTDAPDWPVVITNAAFDRIGEGQALGQALGRPLADVIERLCGRDTALDVSETVRSGEATSFPVELGGQEFLLDLKPLKTEADGGPRYYAAYCRGGAGAPHGGNADMQQALLKAKGRIRDLTRSDPVTGLFNARTFRETFDHDWAVAARENGTLALVVFELDEFDAYVDVFGRHAADSCLRRVSRAIRRCLRRASDVVARIDEHRFVVLSHSSDANGVREFAESIAAKVRELGLHHPRSSAGRFVTVTFEVAVTEAAKDERGAAGCLDALLEGELS